MLFFTCVSRRKKEAEHKKVKEKVKDVEINSTPSTPIPPVHEIRNQFSYVV